MSRQTTDPVGFPCRLTGPARHIWVLTAAVIILWSGTALAPTIPVRAGDKPPEPTITGKERLKGKWADDQRVDDCKVPADKRDREKPRADCVDGEKDNE